MGNNNNYYWEKRREKGERKMRKIVYLIWKAT